MNKKILVLLFIPFMLLFCGCNSSASQSGGSGSSVSSSRPLTKEEYGKAADKAWDEYRDGYGEITKIAAEAENDFSKMKEKSDQLLSACEKIDRALEEFEKLNPPSELKELHSKLLKSIEDEKRWQEYRKKGYGAENEEEANKYLDKIAEEARTVDTNTLFPVVYIEIHKLTNKK